MVTIGEVARYAGVSVATVSRVLNNSESVKPATAQRVMAAIRELDYIPNQSARNLRRSESRVILTLAPNFSNPYYSSILTGIGDLAHDCAYSVLICNTGGQAENEERFLKMLDAHRADGAIFLGCRKNNPLLREYAQHYPIVQCCEYVPEIQQPTVSIDNYTAAAETVRYLIGQGHRRVALLSADNDFISTQQRRQGYCDALAEAGLPCGDELVALADADYSFASGLAAAKRLLTAQPRPTAVFCVSDILALSVISRAHDMGLRVPEDLSVTGFDDVDYTTMFHPHLTTVAQPCYEMGQVSLRLLLRMLGGEKVSHTHTFLPHKLVIRESVAAEKEG